ncbi:MAG: AAA family ATPase [Gammaproteobacteria bacterium]|nr:AAA family ATPase [Gammaproteobacteria bacterium]
MTGLTRHVPDLALEWASNHPNERWRQLEGTLCFADISGFTAIAERLAQHGRAGGEELVATLGQVFTTMIEMARRRGGSLLKFGGDALLLFFQGADHAQQAASAAVEMRHALKLVYGTATSVGPLRLSMSMGLHAGMTDFFLVGSGHRELIVIGPGANAALAAEGAAAAGEIALSEQTARVLPSSAVKTRSDGQTLLRWRRPRSDVIGSNPQGRVVPNVEWTLFPQHLGRYLEPGPPEPEHRVACIAFVRFSGTDSILAKQGPEVLAQALDDTVGAAQKCLIDEGVTLLAIDVDRDGGKLFLAAGVPTSHEDDEGVMLRALVRLATISLPLPLQIGVNRGHVFAAEIGGRTRAAYSAMGDTTNTAARIMSKTPLGEIYAHPSVLDESLTLFDVAAADPMWLKGKKAPLVVYRVGAQTGVRDREGLDVETFVGRKAEIDSVCNALQALSRGKGGACVVTGDPGIGKTKLLTEALRRTNHDPLLHIRAEPYGRNSPYRAFRDPLRGLLNIERGDAAMMQATLVKLIAKSAPKLMPLLALLGEVLQIEIAPSAEVSAIDPRFRPDRIADLVIELLAAICKDPIVMVVDDAQWYDTASSDLLNRLAAACTERPWLMLIATRDPQSGFHPPEGRNVALGPMDNSSLRSLVLIATEAAPLRAHEMRLVLQRASGNPLVAGETIKTAREVGSFEAVPESLEGAVGAQLDGLDPQLQRVLRHASVLGRSFRTAVLAETLGSTHQPLTSTVFDRLEGFLEADGAERMRFRSGIVRDITYERLAYRVRSRLHRAAGEVMEQMLDQPELAADNLALHFHRAGDYGRAWRYACVAGVRAEEAFANVDGARLYELALDAARRLPKLTTLEVVSIWQKLGAVRQRAGQFEDAMRAFHRALQLCGDDKLTRAELLILRARAKERTGAFSQALGDVTRGLRLIERLRSNRAACVRAGLLAAAAMIRMGQDQPREALAYAENAEHVARKAGERASLAQALQVLDVSHLMLDGPGDGARLREALAIYEELEMVSMQAHIRANLGFLCAHAGRWDEAVEWLTSGRETFLRTGNEVDAANTTLNLGEMLVKQRRYDEAEPVLHDAIRVMRATGFAEGVDAGEMQLAHILIARGKPNQADAMLERIVTNFTQAGQPLSALEAAVARCKAKQDLGEPDAALALLDEAIAAAGRDAELLRPTYAAERATTLAAIGRIEDAERELASGLAAAAAHHLPYEEAVLRLARSGLAPLLDAPFDPEDVELASRILANLGVST